MTKITWTNETRKLSELKPWVRNPRQINKEQTKRLQESFEQFGQVETIAIGPDNEVYNGHQRLSVLMQKYGRGYEVEVRVSSRSLDEKEREKLTVFLHKGAAGEWDFEALSEWDTADLLQWGFSENELQLNWFGENNEEIEQKETLRPKTYMRILISIPIDQSIEIKETFDVLSNIPGIEIDYGAN